jgi:hypothetical protein
MVSVIIRNNGEPSVIQYTFDKLYRELKDIAGSELLVKDDWDISHIKNRFICFVEPDCLVDEGYFKKQLALFKTLGPRVIMLSSGTAVKRWDNCIYGYNLDNNRVVPNRKPKSNRPYPVQIAYIPGTIIRTSSLKKLLKRLELPDGYENDLVYYSALMSLSSWENGLTFDDKHPEGQLGSQIYINSETSYATTEDYVNDLASYPVSLANKVVNLFVKESI